LNQASPKRTVTEVAVGIIYQDDQFLLAKRPQGKPYAGYWEFPGGKIEASETVHQALERELEEELGIRIGQSHAWNMIEHDYPHAYVRLHLCLVKVWQGQARGLEGQELHWQTMRAIDLIAVEPLLPATITIIEMMRQQAIIDYKD
jgi:8-oxo-dGTP diphosphatase